MPVGFQSVNDAGAFQIDSELRALTIRNKGVTNSGAIPVGEACSYANIAASADSLIAVRAPGQKIAIVSQWLGFIRVAVFGAGFVNVEWWEFAPHTPATENVGMQLWDAGGNLNYETARGTFNYVATQVGTGAMGLTPGRTYAVIPSVLFSQIYRYTELTGGGPAGDYFMIAIVTTDMAQLDSGLLTVSREDYGAYINGPINGSEPIPVGWADTINNGQTSQYIVVDVTNL